MLGRRAAEQVFQRSLEGTLAAVSDAGIVTSTFMTAARAFGLGIVPIGRIRRDPRARIDLLVLPPNTFTVDRVVLSYVSEESPQKPAHRQCIGGRLGAPKGCHGT